MAAADRRIPPDEVVCPTCRARQAWSDSCRRCQSDLSLLRRLAEAWEGQRRACLLDLAAGRHEAALAHARRCYELAGDAASARLLAVCPLVCSQFAAACGAAERAERLQA